MEGRGRICCAKGVWGSRMGKIERTNAETYTSQDTLALIQTQSNSLSSQWHCFQRYGLWRYHNVEGERVCVVSRMNTGTQIGNNHDGGSAKKLRVYNNGPGVVQSSTEKGRGEIVIS